MEFANSLTQVLVPWLIRTSAHAAVVVAGVGLLTWALRRWLSPGARCALWGLVAVRLVMPGAPSSELSIFNWSPTERRAENPAPPPDALKKELSTGWLVTAGVEPVDAAIAPPGALSRAATHRSIEPSWPRWLSMAWAIGVIAVFGRIIGVNVRLARQVRRGRSPTSPSPPMPTPPEAGISRCRPRNWTRARPRPPCRFPTAPGCCSPA